jgi:glycosyltransferase involved in cell wall biosynthesis
MMAEVHLSVIVPAYNESSGIGAVLTDLKRELSVLPLDAEIVVVDDGSTDETAARAGCVEGVRLLRNPVNLGYGHSLLRGITAARGDLIAICDADGSYKAAALQPLLRLVDKGVDHAIGLRTGPNIRRPWVARSVYRWLCGYVVGCRVPDANSGLRVFRREVAEAVRGDLCRGFSFTTSLTLASIMCGYVVAFTEIPYERRVGRSHVRFRDVLRTSQYLFQLIAAYNPVKLFLPLVLASAFLSLVALAVAMRPGGSMALIGAIGISSVTLMMIGLGAHAYIVSRLGLFTGPPASGDRGRRRTGVPTRANEE